MQYEHAKAEEYENSLDIPPWRFNPDTRLYNAGSQIFYSLIVLLVAAEVLSTKHALGIVRTLNLICAGSIPVVIGLVVLARWQGVYEDYMDYPNNQYVSISNCRLSDICVYEQAER